MTHRLLRLQLRKEFFEHVVGLLCSKSLKVFIFLNQPRAFVFFVHKNNVTK